MKLTFWDIETSPIIAPVWGLWKQDIYYENIIHNWHIICVSIMETDEKGEQISFHSFKSPPGVHPLIDQQVVEQTHQVLEEADVLIAHNGDKFDLKKFNTRAVFYGLNPIPPMRTVDTLKVARKHFKFDSNRLDYLGDFLGLGRKMQTPKGLWMKAIAKDLIAYPLASKKVVEEILEEQARAIDEMSEYCDQDVHLLKDVFFHFRPYITNYPNFNLSDEGNSFIEGCPKCGSQNFHRRGFHRTQVGKKQRFQCKSCHGWFSSRASEQVANLR